MSTAVREPHHPKGEGLGRLPIGPARMLRMYVVQQCFAVCSEGMVDAAFDSQAIRRFISIHLTVDVALDAIELLKFRHSLETHNVT